MSSLKGLQSMGLVIDGPYLAEWPEKVGRFILNFGAIELLSYQYLIILEPTRKHFNKNLNCFLKPGIVRIQSLLQASSKLDAATKAEVKALWEEVEQLAVWRNRISHNPVLPVWKTGSDAEHAPPDLLGVPDMRQLKAGNITDSISLDGISKLIDDSADLGQRLHLATKRINDAA